MAEKGGRQATCVFDHDFELLTDMNENYMQHTSASVTPTPHREHRRDREHGGRRPRQVPDGTTPNQLVLSPNPAHVKSSRRPQTGERGNPSRDIGSVQLLAPTSRRPSQQHRDANGLGSGGPSSHPYATAQNGYRTVTTPNTFGRHSPNPAQHINGHMNMNESESFSYGQPQVKSSPEETGMRHHGGQVRGDFDQMQRGGERDEDGDHGRKGFSRFFCCSM